MRMQEILGGKAALGRAVSSPSDLAEIVRAGLPHSSLEAVMHLLNLPAEMLSISLALSRRTLSRRKKQARLSAGESDRLIRLARVAASAVDVFGSPERASKWLQRPNRALGGVTPLSLMDTDPGARLVEQILGRIEHGVFS